MKVNWDLLQAEYVSTLTSYSKLAKKYGIARSWIATKGKSEGWQKLRAEHQKNTVSAITDSMTETKIELGKQVIRVTEKLLAAVERCLDEHSEELSLNDLHQLSLTIRDIKDILDMRSKLDEEEQELRIEKLKREEENSGPQEIHVIMDGVTREELLRWGS